ncbi:unnamed protein product, partial [Ectocarpus sp. 13 AM-2016]
FESGGIETQPALESDGRASALDQRTSCSTPSAKLDAGIPDLRRARQSEALTARGAAATNPNTNSLLALSSPNLHQRMFSSGSEASPRNDRDYGRGTSSVTSTMDDAFESSGTAVKAGGPLMSPVLRTLASSGSGLAEGMMMPVEEVPILPDHAGDTGGLVVAALGAAGRGHGSSGSSSGSPSRVRRRGRLLSEEPENDDASETGKGNKRRHAPPTPKHRVLSGAWGKLAAPERPAAAAANEEQGGREEQGKDDCATSCGSRSSSEFTSNSNE